MGCGWTLGQDPAGTETPVGGEPQQLHPPNYPSIPAAKKQPKYLARHG